MFGVAIASSSPAVAARCAHARAGAGAVATQNITDPSLGPRILEALGRGAKAHAALDEALAATPYGAYRQLLVVARDGPPRNAPAAPGRTPARPPIGPLPTVVGGGPRGAAARAFGCPRTGYRRVGD